MQEGCFSVFFSSLPPKMSMLTDWKAFAFGTFSLPLIFFLLSGHSVIITVCFILLKKKISPHSLLFLTPPLSFHYLFPFFHPAPHHRGLTSPLSTMSLVPSLFLPPSLLLLSITLSLFYSFLLFIWPTSVGSKCCCACDHSL